jgi:hypothetical protein
MGKRSDNMVFNYFAVIDNSFFIIGIGTEENNETYKYAIQQWSKSYAETEEND